MRVIFRQITAITASSHISAMSAIFPPLYVKPKSLAGQVFRALSAASAKSAIMPEKQYDWIGKE
jgi:hypothetical protein